MILSLFEKYPNRYTYAEATLEDGVLEGPITVTWSDGTVSDTSLEEYNGPLKVDVYESCPAGDGLEYIRSEERMLVEGSLMTGEEYASSLENLKWLRRRVWSLYEVYYDQETHHAVLEGRFRPFCGSRQEASLLATIQSGYWPNWMVAGALEQDLQVHCLEVSKIPSFGTSLFGGYYQSED